MSEGRSGAEAPQRPREMSDQIPTPDQDAAVDGRRHVRSLLTRESLLDKRVMSSTEVPTARMLPSCHVVKIGGRSIIDGGKATTYPLVEAIGSALQRHKLILGTGGGVRTRHVFSVGIDLGLPTGVLAQLSIADALATPTCSAHCCPSTAW
jgi:molybdenum storage protein